MSQINYNNLIGGIDARIAFDDEKENNKYIYWNDAQNIEVYQGLVKTMSGCQQAFETFNGSILGAKQYEVNDVKYLALCASDGNFYLNNNIKKTGLSITSKPVFSQFIDKIFFVNNIDNPFSYSVLTNQIYTTNFYETNNVKGSVCSAFKNRMFIASGATLYYSDLGDESEWRYDPDNNINGGVIPNFLGSTDKIIALVPYGEYLAIYTSDTCYLLSGNEPDNFQIVRFGNMGVSSAYNAFNFNKKQFFLATNNLAIYYLGLFGDLGQLQISDEISQKIKPLLAEIDTNNLQNVYFVPYLLRNQIWLYVPSSNSNYLNTCYILDFNYRTGLSIYKRYNPLNITCAFEYDNKICIGTNEGKIYIEDSGPTFDDQPIEFYIEFPYFSFNDRASLKTCEILKLFLNQLNVNKCTLTINYIHNKQITKTKTIDYSKTIDYWDIFNWDNGIWFKGIGEIIKNIPTTNEFNSIQLIFSGGDINSGFCLRAMSFINVNKRNSY